MQQEDDLRGLVKVMDFMWALSILFVVINTMISSTDKTEVWETGVKYNLSGF